MSDVKLPQNRWADGELERAADVNALAQASLPAGFPYRELRAAAIVTQHQTRWALLAEVNALVDKRGAGLLPDSVSKVS